MAGICGVLRFDGEAVSRRDIDRQLKTLRHLGPDDLVALGKQTTVVLPPEKTIEQGAATSVYLATSPNVEGVTGRYFEDCHEATQIYERADHTHGVAPYALDPSNAERLWHVSTELTH